MTDGYVIDLFGTFEICSHVFFRFLLTAFHFFIFAVMYFLYFCWLHLRVWEFMVIYFLHFYWPHFTFPSFAVIYPLIFTDLFCYFTICSQVRLLFLRGLWFGHFCRLNHHSLLTTNFKISKFPLFHFQHDSTPHLSLHALPVWRKPPIFLSLIHI